MSKMGRTIKSPHFGVTLLSAKMGPSSIDTTAIAVVYMLTLVLALVGIGGSVSAPLPNSLGNLPPFSDYASQDDSFSPAGPGVEWIRGGGATAVGQFMANVLPSYMLANNASFVTFSSLGTSRGYCRLLNFYTECKNPWAGTGSDIQRPLSLDFTVATRGATEANQANYPDMQLYPFGAAPVALVHSIANLTAPLVLSRELAAQIFRKCDLDHPGWCFPGDVRYWNDSRIKALNPGQDDALDAAGEIHVLVRNDSAGITAAVKRAFAIFEANFSSQVNPKQIDADSSTWRSVDADFVYGLLSLGATVRSEPSFISYLPLNLGQDLGLNIIGLTPTGSNRSAAVFPDQATATRAMLERGLDYGSDGVPPSRRTIEFNAGTNYHTWPLMMGAYVAVRLNSSARPNITCQNRKELFKFVRYLLDPDNLLLDDVASKSGMVRMPTEALLDNIDHLEQNFRCEGSLVVDMFPSKTMYSIETYVPDGLVPVMNTLVKDQVNAIAAMTTADFSVVTSPLLTKTLPKPSINSTSAQVKLVVAPHFANTDADDNSSGIARIPFVAIPFVVRFNWCGSRPDTMTNCTTPRINISPATIAKILGGDIVAWDDPRLLAENSPNVTFPSAEFIRLILPPFGSTRDATLAALGASTLATTDNSRVLEFPDLQTSLAFLQKTQFSLFVIPSTSDESITDDEQTTVAMVNGLLPSMDAIQRRIRGDTTAYPFYMRYDLLVPRFFDSCEELKHVHDAGGFLGLVPDPQESLTSHVVDIIRWIVSFPKRAATINQAEGTARSAAAANVLREDLVARVLSSFHGTPLYDGSYLPSSASPYDRLQIRSSFFRTLVCPDSSAVVLESEQLNTIPIVLTYVLGLGLPSVSILIFLLLALWVQMNRHRKVIKFASPAFLHQMLLGAAICVSTLYPLAMQEYNFDRAVGHDPVELARLDAACKSIPWLYTTGYTIVFLALFIKTWRLVKIFDNPRMKRFHRLKDKHLTCTLASGLCFILFLNVAWLFSDPLHWERLPIQLSSDRLTVLSSVGLCTVNGDPWVAVAPLLTATLLIMVGGLILCYKARNLPSDFQESSWIWLCLVLQFQSLLFALLVLTFTGSSSMATFITKVLVVFLNSTGSVLIIFVPKMWALYGWGAMPSSSGGSSKRVQENHIEPGEASMFGPDSFAVGNPIGHLSLRLPMDKDGSSRFDASGAARRGITSLIRIHKTSSFVSHKGGSTKSKDDVLRPTESELRNLTKSLADLGSFDHPSDNAPPVASLASKAYEPLFLAVLSDPAKRNRFRERLVQRRKEEGLDFFVAVIERDRETTRESREEATMNVMRKFILPNAPMQINLPGQMVTKLITACFAKDKVEMLSDAFFHPAAVLHTCELRLSPDFVEFVREELSRSSDGSSSGTTQDTSRGGHV